VRFAHLLRRPLTKRAAILYKPCVAPPSALDRGPVTRPRSLDIVDRGIIEALQANGREPFRRIAARLGVAEATVRARMDASSRTTSCRSSASRTHSGSASTPRRFSA
jgi:hypothetical protein